MEERLIEAIKMNPCLFDKSSSVFRNKYLKERSWQAVTCSIGVSLKFFFSSYYSYRFCYLYIVEDHCKRRWKSLRDRLLL